MFTNQMITTAGIIMGTGGKLLVAYTTLMVHHRVRHEHKVDKLVFKIMKREQQLGVIGISMILLGAILELVSLHST